MASAVTLLVDFTTAGSSGNVNGGGFVFSSQDMGSTGVTFDVTVSAVNPGGGANGASGDIVRINGGLGSTVENSGTFLNVIGGTSEVLTFTISNVTGLGAGQSIQLTSLLSQDVNGSFGGTFGDVTQDSITLTSDNTSTLVVNQSGVDQGSILLAGDDNNAGNTQNTFSHAVGTFAFTNSFDLALTDLTRNDAIVIQGFDFVVVPEPSSTALLGLGSLALILRRRK